VALQRRFSGSGHSQVNGFGRAGNRPGPASAWKGRVLSLRPTRSFQAHFARSLFWQAPSRRGSTHGYS